MRNGAQEVSGTPGSLFHQDPGKESWRRWLLGQEVSWHVTHWSHRKSLWCPRPVGSEQVPAGVRQSDIAAMSLAHLLTWFISTILFNLHLFGFLYFYSLWYLLKFFFKESYFKERMEYSTMVGLSWQSFRQTLLWDQILVCHSLAVRRSVNCLAWDVVARIADKNTSFIELLGDFVILLYHSALWEKVHFQSSFLLKL